MPRVWANDGSEAACTLVFQSEDHNGFVYMTRQEATRFKDNPVELWESDMLDAVDSKRPSRKKRIEAAEFAIAKVTAAQETIEPSPANQQLCKADANIMPWEVGGCSSLLTGWWPLTVELGGCSSFFTGL